MRVLLLLFLTSLVQPLYAFDNDKCGAIFPEADSEHPPYYAPLYIFTMFPSTTSYFSSFGPCSMYRGNNMRSAFIEKSKSELQIDVARGEGEYLRTFAELSGCPSAQYSHFGASLKAGSSQIFTEKHAKETDLTTNEFLQKIDSLIQAEPLLKKSCRLETVQTAAADNAPSL